MFSVQIELKAYLQEERGNVGYKPVVVERSNVLSMGEEYIANIYLVRVEPDNLPQVIVCDSVPVEGFNLGMLQDTLPFISEFQTHEYRYLPKRIGEHSWAGVLINPKDSLQYFFQGSYTVE
ncbi:hypothetical protein [Geofilum rubicundum]|uniref:hypothetical protein n=1 Tax=Geofilum rubicundum TaxID=472113 RepID=UPI0012FA6E6E|nr:hypothetical protein [Geofilum rubicundum]